MPLPEERVYYYEFRECGNVLLCWLPPAELKRHVEDDGVDESILADYPGGVDVEVAPSAFRHFRKRYGLDLGHAPEDLLLAFEAITESGEVTVEGEVKGDVVEELACKDDDEELPCWNERRPVSIDQAAELLRENPMVQRRVDQRLRKLGGKLRRTRGRGPKPEALGKEVLQRIQRSKGDSPQAVFTRLQRRTKGGA